jgi:hypothetical protein
MSHPVSLMTFQGTVLMRPTQIWFSQRKVSLLFGNGWKSMVDTFGEIVSGKTKVYDVPPISVFQHNFHYWVYSGNRRLRVFQELERYRLIDYIPVRIVSSPLRNFETFWVS